MSEQYQRRTLAVECWEYDLGLMGDVADVLRTLADDLDETGAALLSVIVSADDANEVQAVVDRSAVELLPAPAVSGQPEADR